MECILVVLAGIFVLFFAFYPKWKEKHQIVFKSILAGISILMTVLLVITFTNICKEAKENIEYESLAGRLDFVESHLSRGYYNTAMNRMYYGDDYEPEFEYAWERVRMYRNSQLCLIYKAAVEKNLGDEYQLQAQEYEKSLKELCENPEYKENTTYGEYFMNKLGIQ